MTYKKNRCIRRSPISAGQNRKKNTNYKRNEINIDITLLICIIAFQIIKLAYMRYIV